MKIDEIIEVGLEKSLVHIEGEPCDRLLNNDLIIKLYENQKPKKRRRRKRIITVYDIYKYQFEI